MTKVCGVYAFFDAQTGECLYVGESTRVLQRKADHLRSLRDGSHPRKDFCSWFKDHGSDPEKLIFQILEECEPNLLGSLEVHYFNKLNPRFFGQVPHADRQWFHTAETKLKISEANRIRFSDPGAKSAWETTVEIYGYEKAVELTRASGSFARDPERAALAGAKGKGKPKTLDHRAKISQSLKARKAKGIAPIDASALRSAILKSPTNMALLAEQFGVSRVTIRKYLKKFELIELLEASRSKPV